jgi:predicted nucleic acid-binding protein
VLSQQSLNELYRVITDRLRLMPRPDARRFLQGFMPFATAPLDRDTMIAAWRLQDEEGFGWWDSLLLASAGQAGCSHFASEDLQSGRKIGSLVIANPFDPSFAFN